MKAYKHHDGETVLIRIIDQHGFEHEESISGWSNVLDLRTGASSWSHADGRNYPEASDFDLAQNKEEYLANQSKTNSDSRMSEWARQLMEPEQEPQVQDDLPGMSI